MKSKFITVLMIFCLQMAFSYAVSAQKIMKIDEQLKKNSQPMVVKRKGFTAVGKYEFGPYKVISGKTGGTTSITKSPLFGDNTAVNSSTKMSFTFVNDKADTSIANIRVIEDIKTYDGNWFSRTFLNWTEFELEKGEGVFETVFEVSEDTTLWRLAVFYPLSIEQSGNIKVDGYTKFRGRLTDAKTIIEIKKVTESEDGKNSIFSPVLGYEFWQGSKALAAVQVLPFNRIYVWIRDDLDEKLKFILANAVAAMLIKTT